jgi:hypothetical protein
MATELWWNLFAHDRNILIRVLYGLWLINVRFEANHWCQCLSRSHVIHRLRGLDISISMDGSTPSGRLQHQIPIVHLFPVSPM